MQVESNEECSHVNILQYFWPALSYLKAVVLDRFYCIKGLPKVNIKAIRFLKFCIG